MSFADILPATTPRYKYQGIQQCLEIVNRELKKLDQYRDLVDLYIVIEIDEPSFLEFARSDERLLSLSWETYDYLTSSLLIKIDSLVHAVAIGAFSKIFAVWANPIIDPPICMTNSMTVRGETKKKRADISWTLINPPAGWSYNWPILVGEVAYTTAKRRSKLIEDMKFWLGDPSSQVKVALSITIYPRGRIRIEKWTTNSSRLSPFPAQRIEIVREPAPNCPRVTGEMIIKFEDVFLRERKDSEMDFILTASEMEQMAREIWAFQFRKAARE